VSASTARPTALLGAAVVGVRIVVDDDRWLAWSRLSHGAPNDVVRLPLEETGSDAGRRGVGPLTIIKSIGNDRYEVVQNLATEATHPPSSKRSRISEAHRKL
jgi:hypothetical protein